MRYQECRHDTKKPHSLLFVISFLCVFFCAVALGTLRLYGVYLEHRIFEIAARIEDCREENQALSRRCSELLSPLRICNCARDELGMETAEHVATVRIDNEAPVLAKKAAKKQETAKSLLDRYNPFVDKAHAEN